MPGYVSEALHALLAPAKTPPAIVARLNQEVTRYLHSTEARDMFLKSGTEAAPTSPEEFTAIMKSESEKIGEVLKAAGIGVQ
ncbi:Tripartite tricarboxylate transporter family receptor [compost metagenome]